MGGLVSGEYAVTLLVFFKAACYLEGQKKMLLLHFSLDQNNTVGST